MLLAEWSWDQMGAEGMSEGGGNVGRVGLSVDSTAEQLEVGSPGEKSYLSALFHSWDRGRERGRLEKLAEAGDIEAMLALGRFLAGHDQGGACRWLELAAAEGDIRAIVRLASLLKDSNPIAARGWAE